MKPMSLKGVGVTKGWATLVVLAFIVSGGLSCGGEARSARHPATAPPGWPTRWPSSTPRRSPTRNRIASSIASVPTSSRGSSPNTPARDAVIRRYELAEERLKAGQTREAIAELEGLMRDAAAVGGLAVCRRIASTIGHKPIFDLLAIAYLRLGEQENCLGNPTANACILPLKNGGRHTHQEGARGAIARYTELLRHFPDDHGSQWLLNIAYLAIGGYPDSVPKRYLIPNLAPSAKDPFPLFPNIAGNVGLAVTGNAGGLSIEDFNHDGLLDVFTTSSGINDPVHLFLADGHGGYTDNTARAGLNGIVGGLNTVDADYDNDGNVDILVLRGAWLGEGGKFPKSLLRNRGDGTFEDVTFASGLLSFHPTQTAAWADFNLDGYLDLFIGNESYSAAGRGPSHPSQLFLNNRNGTFTEVSGRVGIHLDDFVKGAVWGDVNNDGLPDLFVSVLYGPNRLYINQRGQFDGELALRGTRRSRRRTAAHCVLRELVLGFR